MFHIHRIRKFTDSMACALRKSHVNTVQVINLKTV